MNLRRHDFNHIYFLTEYVFLRSKFKCSDMLSDVIILIIAFLIFWSISLLKNKSFVSKISLGQYHNNCLQQMTDIHRMTCNAVNQEYFFHKINHHNHLKQTENEHKRFN